jgi:hypothetical protein
MPLQLLSGLLIETIDAGVADFRRNLPYFDAVPVDRNNSLSVTDIALSTMVNSRISGNTAAAIFDDRAAIEECLVHIPDLDLIDVENPANEPWLSYLERAITHLDAIHRVGVATATKTLHKKRPGLMPMFDDHRVGGYYWRLGHRTFHDMYLSSTMT